MSEPFLGDVRMFAGNFAPRNYALCNGQLIQISQNDALFSLFGTIYGGDGRTTFGLPDLRGRIPIHEGQGPGLSNRPLGQKSGTETVSLTANQLPSHTHTVRALSNPGSSGAPDGAVFAETPKQPAYTTGSPAQNMGADTVLDAPGSGGAHNNVMPFQCINFIVALVGVYPSRS